MAKKDHKISVALHAPASTVNLPPELLTQIKREARWSLMNWKVPLALISIAAALLVMWFHSEVYVFTKSIARSTSSPGAISSVQLPDRSSLHLGIEVCGETSVAPSFRMVVAPKAREAKLKVLKYGAWNEAIQEKSVGVVRGSGVATLDAPLDEGWYLAQLTVEVGGEPYTTLSQPFHVAPTTGDSMTGKLVVGKKVAAGDKTITLTALEMTPFGSTVRVSSPPGKSYDVILMADGVEIPGPDAKKPTTAVAVVTATSGTVSIQTESVEFSGRGVYNAALTLQIPSAKLFAPVPAGTQSLDVKIVERAAHGAAASEVATLNVPISHSHKLDQIPTMETPVSRRTDSLMYVAIALLAASVGHVGKDVYRGFTR